MPKSNGRKKSGGAGEGGGLGQQQALLLPHSLFPTPTTQPTLTTISHEYHTYNHNYTENLIGQAQKAHELVGQQINQSPFQQARPPTPYGKPPSHTPLELRPCHGAPTPIPYGKATSVKICWSRLPLQSQQMLSAHNAIPPPTLPSSHKHRSIRHFPCPRSC